MELHSEPFTNKLLPPDELLGNAKGLPRFIPSVPTGVETEVAHTEISTSELLGSLQYQGVAEHAGNGGIGLAGHRYIYLIAFSVDGLVLRHWEQQNHFPY